MDIAVVRQDITSGNYHFTAHAIKQMAGRDVSRREIEEAMLNGEIIEEYPSHPYGPCCLMYGATGNARPLHVVASLRPVWIITAYQPDPSEWTDYRTRR